MTGIRRRLGLDRVPGEGGFSLIEVVVAIFIFGLVSMGLIYSMMSVLQVNADSRARQVASNLAAEEIDRARAVEDVLALQPWSTASGVNDPNDPSRVAGPVVLNNTSFTITRSVEWVSDINSELRCGASTSGAALRYKKVNVRVTWSGMRGSARPVSTDTVINPRDPINDATKGTILVSVLTAGGTGAAGVNVSTTSPFAGSTAVTDASGCAYLLRVPPGSHKVKIQKHGYVNEQNVAQPETDSIIVEAGRTYPASFQFDEASTYNVAYPYALNDQRLPTNLKTSFINTLRTHVADAAHSYSMHPSASGYTVVGGDAESCLAADPSNWPSVEEGGVSYVSPTLPVHLASPSVPANSSVSYAAVEVRSIPRNHYIKAVSTTSTPPAAAVFPQCTREVVFSFTRTSNGVSTHNRTIALPYGQWALHSGTNSTFNPTGSNRVSGSNLVVTGRDTVSGNVVTLDPRVPEGG